MTSHRNFPWVRLQVVNSLLAAFVPWTFTGLVATVDRTSTQPRYVGEPKALSGNKDAALIPEGWRYEFVILGGFAYLAGVVSAIVVFRRRQS